MMDYNCNTDAMSSMPWSCGLARPSGQSRPWCPCGVWTNLMVDDYHMEGGYP